MDTCDETNKRDKDKVEYANCPIKPKTVERIFEEIESIKLDILSVKEEFKPYIAQNYISLELRGVRDSITAVAEKIGSVTSEFSSKMEIIANRIKVHDEWIETFENNKEFNKKKLNQENIEYEKFKCEMLEKRYVLISTIGIVLITLFAAIVRPELTSNKVFITFVTAGLVGLLGVKALGKKITIVTTDDNDSTEKNSKRKDN